MRTLKQTVWLGAGIGSIAAVLGYMVGASQTPVASVAIPAVFGLVITSVGLISGSDIDKKLDSLKKIFGKGKIDEESLDKDKLTQVENTLASIQSALVKTPELMGKMLVVFTTLYIAGLSFGTAARLHDWFVPKPPIIQRHLPWASNPNLPPPSNTSDIIDWVGLQDELLELGYTQSQIEQLYSIQVAEWNKEKAEQKNTNASVSPSIPSSNVTGNDNSQDKSTKRKSDRLRAIIESRRKRRVERPPPVVLPTPRPSPLP
jgi:hypothetical protein